METPQESLSRQLNKKKRQEKPRSYVLLAVVCILVLILTLVIGGVIEVYELLNQEHRPPTLATVQALPTVEIQGTPVDLWKPAEGTAFEGAWVLNETLSLIIIDGRGSIDESFTLVILESETHPDQPSILVCSPICMNDILFIDGDGYYFGGGHTLRRP